MMTKGKLQLKELEITEKKIKILAVDTSGATLAAAIMENEKPLAYINKNSGLTHSETLMPEIIKLFEKTGLKALDIDYFVCVNGPGSFTGLRIGIAAMKGLAQAVNKPMVEVSALDGLYKTNENDCEVVCPIIDARREEVYGAVFKNGEKLFGDDSVTLVELTEFLRGLNEPTLFCGDGAISYRERITELMGENAIFASEEKMLQNSVSVGLCGLSKIKNGETVSFHKFCARYIKPSQPEMKLQKNAEK